MSKIKSCALAILNFAMCWLALCGLLNSAIAAVLISSSLKNPQRFPLSEEFLTSFAVNVAMSAIGFTYMLWRCKWQFRIRTLFWIIGLWSAVFALPSIHSSGDGFASNFVDVLAMFAYLTIGFASFVYAIIWASHLQSKK